jgi:hypothetical protein
MQVFFWASLVAAITNLLIFRRHLLGQESEVQICLFYRVRGQHLFNFDALRNTQKRKFV